MHPADGRRLALPIHEWQWRVSPAGQWAVSPTGFTVPTTGRDWYYSTTSSNATTTLWNEHDWTWSTTINFTTTNNYVLTPPAAEQVAAVRARREARSQSRVVARERADELLLSMLNPAQLESYLRCGEFDVVGSAGGRYRIRRGVSGNVDWLDNDGQVGGRLCAHPTMEHGWMPDQDVALAQLLALTTDEVAFVAVANVHHGRRPPILVAS